MWLFKQYKKLLWWLLGVWFCIFFGVADVWVDPAVSITLGITFLAIIFWFAEVLPLHITWLFVAALLVVVWWQPTKEVFQHFFDPVIVLLFGWLVLAILLQRYGLDSKIISLVLRRKKYTAKRFLLLIMMLAALLSMWISNTAAAALMIPLVLTVLARSAEARKTKWFTVTAILWTAYACTVWWIATLIGSPPNFLAVSALQEMGIQFGFIEWMIYALPVTVLLIIVMRFVLPLIFSMDMDEITMPEIDLNGHSQRDQKMIFGVFLVTVIWWLTTSWTGLSSSVVALIPLFLWSMLWFLPKDYLKEINWSVLLLIGSGIALGNALYVSGTAEFITDWFLWVTQWFPWRLVVFSLGILWVLLTMFASNTASAALLIPLVTPIWVHLWIPIAIIIFVWISVSLDFTAPMGTPPNAMAYSTGLVSIRQMAKTWLLLSVISVAVVLLVALTIWPLIG